MLEGNTIFFKCLQYLSAETDLGVHHIFFNIDGAEALLAGDAGDERPRVAVRDLVEHQRARIPRTVGIEHVNRNVVFADREYCVFVQNASSHVGEFAQLRISDLLDVLRIGHNARVGHQEARYVRPVFVEVRLEAARKNGTRNVRAPTGHHLDLAVRRRAVEPRHNEAAVLLQNALEVFRRLLKIKRAVKLHRYDVLGIHEGEAEEIGHQTGGEVFAAARNVVNREVGERFAESAELFLNGRIEAELVLNLEEPPLNQIKDGLAVHVIFNMGAAEVEEIGELIVFRGFAAGSGNNDEAS